MSQTEHPAALYQLRKVTRIIAILILVLVFLGLFLPSDYRVERSIKINASSALVYQNMLKGDYLPQWMFIQDGRVDAFDGNLAPGQVISLSYDEFDEVGQLILVSVSRDKIRFDVRPNSKVNIVHNEMSLAETDGETWVKWTIQGELNAGLLGPYLAYFANDIAGANFEISLERLKEKMEQITF
ncbi:polyketide cyclase [Marinomonas sp.]|nr:polyketide cyclase [Marinomonas sp.]MDB4837960.1 polyketide cyclase [Marinomonas sp.]